VDALQSMTGLESKKLILLNVYAGCK